MNDVRYRETIPLGKVYNLAASGAMAILAVLTIIFIATDIFPGALSTGLTFLFMVIMFVTLKDAKIFVTSTELLAKYWFLTLRIKLGDISSIEIKDVNLLPENYRGHLKIFWGVEMLKDLKVVKLRQGDAVHIRTKDGKTTIITAQDNKRLAEALRQTDS